MELARPHAPSSHAGAPTPPSAPSPEVGDNSGGSGPPSRGGSNNPSPVYQRVKGPPPTVFPKKSSATAAVPSPVVSSTVVPPNVVPPVVPPPAAVPHAAVPSPAVVPPPPAAAAPVYNPPIYRNPHVFEIRVGETIYYVGEDPTTEGENSEGGCLTSTECGIGLEQALSWEAAIRQALMPVTPQPSVEPDKSRQN